MPGILPPWWSTASAWPNEVNSPAFDDHGADPGGAVAADGAGRERGADPSVYTTGTVVEPHPGLDPADAVDEDHGLGLALRSRGSSGCQSSAGNLDRRVDVGARRLQGLASLAIP